MELTPNPVEVLFSSSIVKVGRLDCPTSHPRFGSLECCRHFCIAFPRTAVWIASDGRPAFVADANVVSLAHAGRPYRRRPISDEGDHTNWFSIAPHVLREMHDDDPCLIDVVRATTPLFLAQRQLIHRLTTEAADPLDVDETVIRIVNDLFAAIDRRPRPLLTHARHRAIVEHARQHLNLTFAGHDGLATLARVVGVSEFHLCRVFKSQTGLTIHAYRRHLRLRRALDLLAGEGTDLLTIALALGYSGHSHFTASFRRAFGIAPSEVRTLSRQRLAGLSKTLDPSVRAG